MDVINCDKHVTPFKKFFVRIVNNLDNKRLDFDCRSEDSVIDRSLPASGDEFEFGFRVNFQFTTYFFCNLWSLDHLLSQVTCHNWPFAIPVSHKGFSCLGVRGSSWPS
ncbi:hypothetical protein PRUPE_1G219300 [Prunus persica]|uniref:Uncharacterized protein n=1 Tax=Prunus persica TaxID=3760 RepID=A0A251R1B0_PRUPE|nr:hypothetical protein PRUPE_1G219300 [Prunus persica]